MRIHSPPLSALFAPLVLFASFASASKKGLGILHGKITVTSPDGVSDSTYALDNLEPVSKPIALPEAGTFKLSFTAVDTASSKGVFPQQAQLLFEDHTHNEDVTLPVTVKDTGKASFTINTAKPHPALLSLRNPVHMTLILSSLEFERGVDYPLGQLLLPASMTSGDPERKRHDLPPRAGEPAFQAQQELFHTFNPLETTVGWTKSFIGIGLVLSPWLLFAGLYPQVSSRLIFKAPPATSYAFLATLAAIEVLCCVYWVKLKLYQVLRLTAHHYGQDVHLSKAEIQFLPWFIGLASLSAYVGKLALGELRRERLKAGGTP